MMRFFRILFFTFLSTIWGNVLLADNLRPEVVEVWPDAQTIDLAGHVQIIQNTPNKIVVPLAPGAEGIARRMEVSAKGKNINKWLVFTLANPSDEQIDRLLVIPHYRLAGSKIIWPELDQSRLDKMIASEGFQPIREPSDTADVYAITLNPGSNVTFVGELTTTRLPQIVLWQPQAYKDSLNSYTLYQGILIGIASLLAIFFSIIFVIKNTSMFPATALLAWAVLGYLCIDFGFWNKVIQLQGVSDPFYRALFEVLLAGAVSFFLYAYLSLGRWHIRYRYITITMVLVLLVLSVLAITNPSFASGFARVILGVLAVFGFGIILYLALKRFDRAILLLPTWILFMAWTLAAFMSVSGILTNDMVQPALDGGLVLLVLLMGFSTVQHAFSSETGSGYGQHQRASLAVTAAGYGIWDWQVEKDTLDIHMPSTSKAGMSDGKNNFSMMEWLKKVHPRDKDRLQVILDAILYYGRGRINDTFRLMGQDSSYRWFQLKARPMVDADGEITRIIGTFNDITQKISAEDRLLNNAIYDSLTNLPNRNLLENRLEYAVAVSADNPKTMVALILFDIDQFKLINDNLGVAVGDAVLLTFAQRLTKLLKPQYTLARLRADHFALLAVSDNGPDGIMTLAASMQRLITVPISFNEQEIYLKVSIGIALYDTENSQSSSDLITNAELALYNAKTEGGNQIAVYTAQMREKSYNYFQLARDLQNAIERNEIQIVYQPVIHLKERTIAGFEALARWHHPEHGEISPAEFIPFAERFGLIDKINIYILETATHQLAQWYRNILGKNKKEIYVSVNLSAEILLQQKIVSDCKSLLLKTNLPYNSLRLEITETHVMSNPEMAERIVKKLRQLGIGIILDDFGSGHASLEYLQRFAFDFLKLDKHYIDTNSGAVLKMIIALARELGLEVIAEGVEDETNLTTLMQMQCHYAQGYFLHEPVSSEKAGALLSSDIRIMATAI